MTPRDEARMSLVEHLGELRNRILVVAAAFVVFAVVAWFFRVQVFQFIIAPGNDVLEGTLYVTGVTEQFLTDLKLALYTAFVFTIPLLIYQAWAFVAPAVGEVGRLFTYTLIALISSLFLAGVAFCYYVLMPIGLPILLTWGEGRYEDIITAQFYLGFATRFMFATGLVFELPAAAYLGAKLGLLSGDFLTRYRKHAIVVNAIIAAAITPGQDPFTMIMLAVPLLVMYEVSIVIARYVKPFPGLAADYDLEEFEET